MSDFLLCCLLVSMFGALCYAGRLIMKEDQFVQSIKDEHKTLLLTVNAQRKDIEDYLEKIRVLLENNKIITSSATRCNDQLKEKQERIEELEGRAKEIQEGYLSEIKRSNSIKTDLKLARDTIRKLNRRAQQAESELIKSKKYHKNTKTYFKDRLEWSLDALQDARNLVTQLGNKIDWHLKTCKPFEKKEAESPQNGFQGDPNKENLSHIPPGSTFEMDENGKVGEIWPPVRYKWEPNKGTWVKIATVKPEGDSMVMHKETK